MMFLLHRLPIILIFLMTGCWAISVHAQTESWQEVWQETANEEDEQAEEDFTLLQELAVHPLNLNQATREELEQLPFLSAQQVMDVMEHRDRFGAIRSVSELRMVRSLDYRQLRLLPFFTYLGEEKDSVRRPGWQDIIRNGRHELTFSGRIPFYERKGDRNGYLGYRYRHWLRYEFTSGDYVRVGLIGSQDAGEPFLANRNKWGYDAYHYYVQLGRLGCVEKLILGHYRLSVGLGLVMNNSFSTGKLATLQHLGRTGSTLRPQRSRSVADGYQGIAATIRLARPLRLTAFASYRPLDATLNDSGSVRTIVTSGYHRTKTEMQKKHNTHETDAGLSLSYSGGGLQLGLNSVYTRLDRRLSPLTSTLYRRYYPQGNSFLNTSLYYAYTRHWLSFHGETALDGHAHLATLHALSCQLTDQLSLVALHRFYSYRYTCLHAHAFSEGTGVQNEQGLFVGATWKPLRQLQLSAYADWAYFPWARYRVSKPSTACDYLGEMIWQIRPEWTLKGRYRLHQRQQDDSLKQGLRQQNEHRERLTLAYNGTAWSTKTQLDMVQAVAETTEKGGMISQQIGWSHRWLRLNLTAGWFDAPDYSARIYVYEPQLSDEFSFPMYYGRGFRLALLARANIGRRLTVQARMGQTYYQDRQTTGSGLQETDTNRLTDLDIQLRLSL